VVSRSVSRCVLLPGDLRAQDARVRAERPDPNEGGLARSPGETREPPEALSRNQQVSATSAPLGPLVHVGARSFAGCVHLGGCAHPVEL
jgi:hypothetical protein